MPTLETALFRISKHSCEVMADPPFIFKKSISYLTN
nr:MAG TPA: hypothetical protein [Caudoviricetes sp.]